MFLLEMLQITLILYWTICVLLSICTIMYQILSKSQATTSTRKYFHILAVFVYIPGMIYDPSLLYLASGMILALFIIIEVLIVYISYLKFLFIFPNKIIVDKFILGNPTFEHPTFGRNFTTRIYCIR